ncbi:MAG: transcription-repair coupling factor [Clostridia bacterium]|nr:transcription-repair coupling factor [Clostridia bacterium]
MARKLINVSGVSDKAYAPVIATLASKEKEQNLVIVSSLARAKALGSDLSFFTKKPIYVLSGEDHVFLKFDARSSDEMINRLAILKALRTEDDALVIAPVSAAIKKMIPKDEFRARTINIKRGGEVDLDELKEKLVGMGYERMQLVDTRGQFAVRGDIVDVFTPDGEYPYRIELFGSEVDSIRTFDPDDQRSIENLTDIEIDPAKQIVIDKDRFENAKKKIEKAYKDERLQERKNQIIDYIDNLSNMQLLENYIAYFYDEPEFIWNYMRGGNIIVEDPDRVMEVLELRDKEMTDDVLSLVSQGQMAKEDAASLSTKEDFLRVYSEDSVYVVTTFPKRVKGVDDFTSIKNMRSRNMLAFHGHMELLASEIRRFTRDNYQIHIVCSTENRLSGVREYIENLQAPGKYHYHLGELSGGFDFPEDKVCYITESDIFDFQRKPKAKRKKEFSHGQKIQSFTDLAEGDYVVHESYGIGRFVKIEQLKIDGEVKDYIKIKYAGTDVLNVPVDRMDRIQKYIGSDGNVPKLHKLSGGEWKIQKARAKEAIAEMAQELVKISAIRKARPGYAFKEDDQWQREFEESFPFEETDDQLRSIEEIKQDMQKPIAMDRLLCGDVGFGKTEVAARAIFKCLSEGKQAAFLVPTTILANQHYYTLVERLEKFPFNVELLSRFKTEAEQKETLKKLEAGQVDLVIGTHRLLSSDVKFKDLGLLVIDEEQRFGVSHKEAIKKLKENVDVLTLSATPIPRTLNMSLTGIKDMSLIEEPPEERYPVQTYVLEEEENLLREVIQRELDRGGQAFVVYNRVRGINQVAQLIEELVPDARVAVGHGQMKENTLENIMLDFINGNTNVLVATTIIESGIDIPNANTMVILNADHFGLSQLYQLRGRVGRSTRVAYAYLMYQRDKVLTEASEKRLKAIKDFTEFGAGFKVAMKDLEIRGAGNLLGSQQSGHIMNVGYELYCKMVEEAIASLEGEVQEETIEDVTIEFNESAYIPERYIENPSLKLQMYKKIAAIKTLDDEEEILDELLDRFGDIPKETVRLVKISRMRKLALSLGVERIHMEGGKVIFDFSEENALNPYGLMRAAEDFGMRVFIHAGKKPMIKLSAEAKKIYDDSIKLLETLKEGID